MSILSLDTSGLRSRWVGIEGGVVVKPVDLDVERKHDETLANGLRSWMKETGWGKPDAMAVVVGPGGYTGLRVGVAFVTSYAMSLEIPVIPISTFELVASTFTTGLVWALVPLRKQMCRGRLMKAGLPPEALAEATEVLVLEAELPTSEPLTLSGEGYDKYKSEFDQQVGNLGGGEEAMSSIEALAQLAECYWKAGRRINPTDLDVDYGAEFQPTQRKKAKQA